MKRILGIVCLGASLLAAAELKLGKPLTVKEPTTIEKVYAEPEKFLGKTVAVKGKITEVCQMMGCWMNLVDSASGKSIRIKVNDGEIEFPKNGAGKMAIAEGTLTKIELSKERAIAEAKHEADEMGRKFDPKSVLGPVTRYQIKGSGAVVLD
jgi:hypothetical protein